jgi:membrane-associated phospholipid phosphatase
MRGALRHLMPVLITMAFVGVVLTIYFFVANDGQPGISTRTSFDAGIPVWPWTAWVYISPYILGPLLVASCPRPLFVRLMARASVTLGISLVLFALVPTVVERPDIFGLDPVLSVRLLHDIYAVDTPPRNAAPSGHVCVSILLAWCAWRIRPATWWRAATTSYAVAVALSILPTGQHHVVDLVTGATLAGGVLVGFALYERSTRLDAADR